MTATFPYQERFSLLHCLKPITKAPLSRARGRGRGWGQNPSPQPRIERITQTVTEQVEAEDGDRDGDAGKDRHPRRGFEEAVAAIEHRAPGGRGRLIAQPEIRQGRLRQYRI